VKQIESSTDSYSWSDDAQRIRLLISDTNTSNSRKKATLYKARGETKITGSPGQPLQSTNQLLKAFDAIQTPRFQKCAYCREAIASVIRSQAYRSQKVTFAFV
jgi:hypothetical protein